MTVTDLDTAYRQQKFFIISAKRTLDSLQSSMVLKDNNIAERTLSNMWKCFYLLCIIMNNSLKILGSEEEES